MFAQSNCEVLPGADADAGETDWVDSEEEFVAASAESCLIHPLLSEYYCSC